MDEPDPLVGTRYRALSRAGAGAMGDVFLAENPAIGRPVVVKLLQAELASNHLYIDRMRLEAQTLGRLDHPNVVGVSDFAATPSGRVFLVMERLVGRTLAEERTARGGAGFEIGEALELIAGVLRGLSAVHALGVVHRDLKPSNLFYCAPVAAGAAPFVKIIDFGIVKVTEMRDGTPSPIAIPTAAGIAIGTPRFFAPEQAMGRPVDARTDVYSAGVVLYWLLAGKDPFHACRSLIDIMRAQVEDVPQPPSTLNPKVTPALDAIVLKALAKAPGDRYQSAAEFERAVAASAVVTPAHQPRWPKTELVDAQAIKARLLPQQVAAPSQIVPDTDAMPTIALPTIPTSPPVALPAAPGPAQIIERGAPPARRRLVSVVVAAAIVLLVAVLLGRWLA
jgi:serine/threonine-protein kinase